MINRDIKTNTIFFSELASTLLDNIAKESSNIRTTSPWSISNILFDMLKYVHNTNSYMFLDIVETLYAIIDYRGLK